MKTFFTSDIHLFHKNILKFEPESRPFGSIDEMHDTIISRWNNKVTAADRIFILGDVSFGKVTKTLEILSELNGKKILIKGNHDEHHVLNREFVDFFENKIYDTYEAKINGTYYFMCHYPLICWNKSHYGSINLFGHVHSVWKGNSNQLNVGMDCHSLTPIEESEIKDLLKMLPENNNGRYSIG